MMTPDLYRERSQKMRALAKALNRDGIRPEEARKWSEDKWREVGYRQVGNRPSAESIQFILLQLKELWRVKISIITSCSLANVAVVSNGHTHILIDAGLGRQPTLNELYRLGIEPKVLNFILVTHLHTDHIAGAAALSEWLKIPVVMTPMQWGEFSSSAGKYWLGSYKSIDTNEFKLGSFDVTRVPVPHDATDASGFVLESSGVRLGWFVDLGHIDDDVKKALATCDYALLEANFDEEMLMRGSYHPALKERLLSNYGHLSNTQVANWVREMPERIRGLIIGHLSSGMNTPWAVQREIMAALGSRACDVHVVTDRLELTLEER